MMKYRILLANILLASFLSLGTYAQSTADELLKTIVDKTNAYESLEIDFTYIMLNEAAGIREEKEGKVYVKGDAYKLLIAGQAVISDGKTVWTYLEESREVMINDAEEGEDAITPGNLLTSYYNDFSASFVNVKENAAKGLKTIELKPQEGKAFSKMQLAVDEAKLQIDSFSVFDNNGSNFIYKINKMKTDVELQPEMFTFNPEDFPELEDIIDMR
jgi:outer membrane lipoprotein carrier protein